MLVRPNDKRFSAEALPIGSKRPISYLLDQLEFQLITTPPRLLILSFLRRFGDEFYVKRDESNYIESTRESTFHPGQDLIEIRKISFKGEIDIERITGADAVNQAYCVSTFENELLE